MTSDSWFVPKKQLLRTRTPGTEKRSLWLFADCDARRVTKENHDTEWLVHKHTIAEVDKTCLKCDTWTLRLGKTRRPVKKHILGSSKQLRYCPASLLVKGVATKVPTKMSSASSASHLHVLWCASQCQQENRWIWRRRAGHESCAWRSGVLYLRLPEGQSPPNFKNQNSTKGRERMVHTGQ